MALEQSAYINLQRTGELHYIFHPYVSFAAFDPADIRRMQARSIGFSAYFMKSRTTHGRQHRQARKPMRKDNFFAGGFALIAIKKEWSANTNTAR